MENQFIVTIPYKLVTEKNRHEQTIVTLYKTHYFYNNVAQEFSEPIYLKHWDSDGLTQSIIDNECILNIWDRWNTELVKGQKVEISEHIFYDLLGCVPPKKQSKNYFEVGEANHHENGKAIHRACWVENGLYYTGYPFETN